MKIRIPKVIRRTFISALVLIILFLAAGTVYVLVADRAEKPALKAKADTSVQEPSFPKPVAPAATAAEGVAVESVTSPVAAGANSSITVMTNAGSKCTITVSYAGVPSTDSGLAPTTADAYGNATWTWTVGASVPAGNWPISVTCAYHGRTGMVSSSVQVTK